MPKLAQFESSFDMLILELAETALLLCGVTGVPFLPKMYQCMVLGIDKLSNEILKVSRSHFWSWFWVLSFWAEIQPTAKWTSLECSIHADFNGRRNV